MTTRRRLPDRRSAVTFVQGLLEQDVQRAVFRHLLARGAPGSFCFHPANGGFRLRTEAAILKGLGVRPGVPDLVGVRNGQMFALELKIEGGRLSAAQREAQAALRVAGAMVATSTGLDEALGQLEAWGLLRGVVDRRGRHG